MKVTEKLNDKKSVEIIKSMHRFINHDFKTIQVLPKIEISRKIQDFVSNQVDLFGQIWKVDLVMNSAAYAEICDTLEKNIMVNLYNRVFSFSHIDIEEDYRFEMKVESLKFISVQHLDINPTYIDESYINLAVTSKLYC